MTSVYKEGVRMSVRDGNQLAAFLNNGWKPEGGGPDESLGKRKINANPEMEADKQTSFSKTDINRMSKDDLVSLATMRGIKNPSEISGSELKRALIGQMGL